MHNTIKYLSLLFFALSISFIACKKTEYTLGSIKTPSNLDVTTQIAGATPGNPTGDGSGNVTILSTATDAMTYKIDFGDGSDIQFSSGSYTHKYTSPDTGSYTITVTAIGTGGAVTTTTKNIRVFVQFAIPDYIVQDLTGGTSKIWVTYNDTVGHVGVGQTDLFYPNYYAATPNTRAACQYDDEITFSKTGNSVSMSINNKGQTFIIAAATAGYGFSGGDGCYNVNAAGVKGLSFQNATSTSTSANSTRIQFRVPGDGIVNFATGGKDYEIITITPTSVQLRNIGADGLAWYQVLKLKP